MLPRSYSAVSWIWGILILSLFLCPEAAIAACNMTEVCKECSCDINKNTTVTCNNLFLQGKAFFPQVCETVTDLAIFTSDIVEIKDETLAHLVNLKTLKLTDSPLENISENAFQPLRSLETLVVQNTSLSVLLPATLVGLAKIQQVTFSQSFITNITVDHFTHLNGTLQKLNLSKNKIADVIGGFFNVTNSLTNLDLSDNSLVALDNSTLKFLSKVTDLTVENNYLGSLTNGSFEDMTSLNTLTLSRNSLNVFPKDTFLHSTVTMLNVSDNLLNQVAEISKLENLQVLDLDGNSFAQINKDDFPQLYKLKELRLSRLLFLSTVDGGSFANQSHLEKLYLSQNPQLAEIHPNAFSVELPNLKELYINDNGLTKIPEDMFNGTVLSGLEKVQAQGNPLLCSCDVIWIRNDMDDVTLEWIQAWKDGPTAVTCANPERFNGTKVSEVDIENLTCEPPNILSEDQFLETNNENFFMEVLVSEGLPTTKWITASGVTLVNGDKHDPESGGNDIVRVKENILNNGTVLSQLFINHPTYKSKGYYTFVASNAGGTIQEQYLAKPPNLPVKKPKTGLIVGIVFGGLVVCVLVGVVIYLARKKPYERMVEERQEGDTSDRPTYGSVDKLVNETESPPGTTEEA